jgi:hypothetical protein
MIYQMELLLKATQEQQKNAQKSAYYFFYQQMYNPFKIVREEKKQFTSTVFISPPMFYP